MPSEFIEQFDSARLRDAIGKVMDRLRRARTAREARRMLFDYCGARQFGAAEKDDERVAYYIVRDCARALGGMFTERAERISGFSLSEALWHVAMGYDRPDLSPAFFADLTYLFLGLRGRGAMHAGLRERDFVELSGRSAALARSDELDRLWSDSDAWMHRYEDGLSDAAQARRAARRAHVAALLGGTEDDWNDWRWQVDRVLVDPDRLAAAVRLRPDEDAAVRAARAGQVPFGITPYYASLMDDDPECGRDRAVRAQVLPPADYVCRMREHWDERACRFDFMREQDTSPIDLVTRRYPGIVILKPFNTCPQICVYCQRNWEITRPMAPDALAAGPAFEAACDWIEQHPSVREVLVTGGDPLVLDDDTLLRLLDRVAAIAHVDLIRIGTRIPVTVPMRITERLADRLGALRAPGRRDVVLVTHIEHVYEVTPELVAAVNRLRQRGISVYNQMVYTFYVSRRFEATRLRMLLRRIGVDPYYTFMTKGKEEMAAYRVPLARLVQEQKEEARLLPGLRRNDEAVINLPGLGKSNLRAAQHRDLISINPAGARVYEFQPWERNTVSSRYYVGEDVPILDYLARLAAMGEAIEDYAGIWYHF